MYHTVFLAKLGPLGFQPERLFLSPPPPIMEPVAPVGPAGNAEQDGLSDISSLPAMSVEPDTGTGNVPANVGELTVANLTYLDRRNQRGVADTDVVSVATLQEFASLTGRMLRPNATVYGPSPRSIYGLLLLRSLTRGTLPPCSKLAISIGSILELLRKKLVRVSQRLGCNKPVLRISLLPQVALQMKKLGKLAIESKLPMSVFARRKSRLITCINKGLQTSVKC